ncbi:hypothetical protein [Streptomyces sp. NPDC048349]|uniref:hypothetical protein n=1 Tax=Streptomyces sp. NPDC048349 TaxID=3155486 RepID=UPI00343F73D2
MDEAIAIEEQVAADSERLLGGEHPSTLHHAPPEGRAEQVPGALPTRHRRRQRTRPGPPDRIEASGQRAGLPSGWRARAGRRRRPGSRGPCLRGFRRRLRPRTALHRRRTSATISAPACRSADRAVALHSGWRSGPAKSGLV